jgi:hypothetical protein
LIRLRGKLLLSVASIFFFHFGPHRDLRSQFCPFQDSDVIWTGTSSWGRGRVWLRLGSLRLLEVTAYIGARAHAHAHTHTHTHTPQTSVTPSAHRFINRFLVLDFLQTDFIATQPNRLMLFIVKTVGNTQLQPVPHRKHITSPLQSPTG